MKGLKSVYIVDSKESNVYFSYELFNQGSCEIQSALLSPFIVAFQHLAGELNQKETNLIELMDKKFFSAIDQDYHLIFVLITELKVKNKQVFNLLEKIKLVCISNLKIYSLEPEEMQRVKASIFEKDILEILGIKTRAADFLQNL
jgi:hypothetical protein